MRQYLFESGISPHEIQQQRGEGRFSSLLENRLNHKGPPLYAIPDPDPVCFCNEKCTLGAVNTNCPVCVLSWKDCAGTITVDPVDPEQTKDSGGAGTTILVLIAAAAVGSAGWYLKIYRPKKELADAKDFDDLTSGDEEPTANEDDLPTHGEGPEAYPEPDEPPYPDGYGEDK